MDKEVALQEALRTLHRLEYEVWTRLLYQAANIGNSQWRVPIGYQQFAEQCGGCSEKTIQRAVRRLRDKEWLTVSETSRVAVTAFTLSLPNERQGEERSAWQPAIDSFSQENREAFIIMKKTLSTGQLAEIEDEAQQWLIERGIYNRTTLRDKIDHLIMWQTLGPIRSEECQQYFDYLYAGSEE